MTMEKKKYLFPNLTVISFTSEVIVMSGTWSDTDDKDTVVNGGWTL